MRRFDLDRMQAAIYTGWTDFQEQLFCVLGDVNFFATFQYFISFRQEWLQTFGTDLHIDLPDLFEHLHRFATIDGFVGFGFPFKVVLNLHLVFQYADRMFPMVPGSRRKLVQNLLFFKLARFQVSGSHSFYQFMLAFQTHHVAPPTGYFTYRKVSFSLNAIRRVIDRSDMWYNNACCLQSFTKIKFLQKENINE